MSATENLKNFVKQMYLDAAKEKEDVDNAIKLSNLADEVEKENQSLVEKNASLVNAYKEVAASATGNKAEPTPTETPEEPKDFETIFNESLKNFESQNQK